MKRVECTIPLFEERINNPQTAVEMLQEHFKKLDCNVENFVVAVLNTSLYIIRFIDVSKGGVDSSIVDVKSMFYEILRTSCARSIMLAHNHPSGNTTPSDQDIQLTRQVARACEFLDIRLCDHLIITDRNGFTSFREKDLI